MLRKVSPQEIYDYIDSIEVKLENVSKDFQEGYNQAFLDLKKNLILRYQLKIVPNKNSNRKINKIKTSKRLNPVIPVNSSNKLKEPIINIYTNGKEYKIAFTRKTFKIEEVLSKRIWEDENIITIRSNGYYIKKEDIKEYVNPKFYIGICNKEAKLLKVFYEIEFDSTTSETAHIVARNLYKKMIKKDKLE